MKTQTWNYPNIGINATILWFTGMSGAGKTTIAKRLKERLANKHNVPAVIIDGDELRRGICSDLGFSMKDRMENVRRAAEIAKLFSHMGYVAIVTLISPLDQHRMAAREICTGMNFLEIFIHCPLETCEQRDVKGLYERARAGEINDFTGIQSPFEFPDKPNVIISTHQQTVEESCSLLIGHLATVKII